MNSKTPQSPDYDPMLATRKALAAAKEAKGYFIRECECNALKLAYGKSAQKWVTRLIEEAQCELFRIRAAASSTRPTNRLGNSSPQ